MVYIPLAILAHMSGLSDLASLTGLIVPASFGRFGLVCDSILAFFGCIDVIWLHLVLSRFLGVLWLMLVSLAYVGVLWMYFGFLNWLMLVSWRGIKEAMA